MVSGAGTSLDLSLAGTLFQGQVLNGDEPVRADLRFDAVDPKPGESQAVSTSRTDGSFMVLLPRAGDYDVHVSIRRPVLETTVPDVAFSHPEKPVTVRLPRGRIDGTVVDEEGTPVPDADVMAYVAPRQRETKTARMPPFARSQSGADGSFAMAGLVPGAWRISAKHGDLSSDPVNIDVTADGETTPVTLVVREGLSQRGVVRLLDGQPVAHAYVIAYTQNAAGLLGVAHTTTDVAGRFELRCHAHEGNMATIVVSRAGLAAQPFRAGLAPKRTLEFRVTDAGGKVVFVVARKQQRLLAQLAFVRPDGAFASLGSLVGELSSRRTTKGMEVTIADLAPGQWSVVGGGSPAAMRALSSGAGAGLPAVARFVLAPGATRRIPLGRCIWRRP